MVLLLLHLLLDLRKVGIASSLVVRRTSLHSPVFHEDDIVSQFGEFDCVGGHEYGLTLEILLHCLLHDAGRYVNIYCTDDIVE